jgi:hypothetical protein
VVETKKWKMLMILMLIFMIMLIIFSSIGLINSSGIQQQYNYYVGSGSLVDGSFELNSPLWTFTTQGSLESVRCGYSFTLRYPHSGNWEAFTNGPEFDQIINVPANANITSSSYWVCSDSDSMATYTTIQLNYGNGTAAQHNDVTPAGSTWYQHSFADILPTTNTSITRIYISLTTGYLSYGAAVIDDVSLSYNLYTTTVIPPNQIGAAQVMFGIGLFGATLLIVAPVYAIENFLDGEYINALGISFLMFILGFAFVVAWLFG